MTWWARTTTVDIQLILCSDSSPFNFRLPSNASDSHLLNSSSQEETYIMFEKKTK